MMQRAFQCLDAPSQHTFVERQLLLPFSFVASAALTTEMRRRMCQPGKLILAKRHFHLHLRFFCFGSALKDPKDQFAAIHDRISEYPFDIAQLRWRAFMQKHKYIRFVFFHPFLYFEQAAAADISALHPFRQPLCFNCNNAYFTSFS